MIRRLLRTFTADGWAWLLAVALLVAAVVVAVAQRGAA